MPTKAKTVTAVYYFQECVMCGEVLCFAGSTERVVRVDMKMETAVKLLGTINRLASRPRGGSIAWLAEILEKCVPAQAGGEDS